MAGTITVGTISDGTNSASATDAIKGSCRAWCHFNGQNTVSIYASYNCSSITDRGTGQYTINLSTAMSDNNYAALGWGQESGSQNRMEFIEDGSPTRTTSAIYFVSYYDIAYFDQPRMSVAIFR